MIMSIKSFLLNIMGRGPYSQKRLLDAGVKMGENVYIGTRKIDLTHGFLLEIGNNVTLSDCRILLHDASTKMFLGYSKVGKVVIGNNVFIGAGTVILPSVRIGNNVIIGANSTVTRNIPDNSVAFGSPAKVVKSLEEYLNKEKQRMAISPCFDDSYTLRKRVNMDMRMNQKKQLDGKWGYIE